jgi:protein-disulfide isomerase
VMKTESCPQERGHFRSWWLKGTVLVLLLGLLLGCVPAGLQSSTGPTPTRQFIAPATPTNVPTPSPGAPQPTPTQSAPTSTLEASPTPFAIPEELPSKGSPEAKVTLVEFSEFLCPYCARFATETVPQVEKEYVTTGLVQIVFVDFIVHGEPAILPAEAAHCAQDQGQFWAYHDLLFENFSGDAPSREQLDSFARTLNLDMTAFGQCLDSQKYRTFVLASTQIGESAGVDSTPTLIVNQQMIPGFLPFEDLKPIIEEELQNAP